MKLRRRKRRRTRMRARLNKNKSSRGKKKGREKIERKNMCVSDRDVKECYCFL